MFPKHFTGLTWSRPLGYERPYLLLREVADTASHIRGDDVFIIIQQTGESSLRLAVERGTWRIGRAHNCLASHACVRGSSFADPTWGLVNFAQDHALRAPSPSMQSDIWSGLFVWANSRLVGVITGEERRNILFLCNLKTRLGFEAAITDFTSR